MFEFSRSWLEAFRSAHDMDDYVQREETGRRPDDLEWWNSHRKEIGFFFQTLQTLDLGYITFGEKNDTVVFCARKAFKRHLLKGWKPLVMDIATDVETE